jgi:hypothetical protein
VTKRFGAAVLVVGLMFGVSAHCAATAASGAMQQAQTRHLGNVSARHRTRGVDRLPYPSYYGRPTSYRPAPFFPFPPLFGYGWESW